MKTHPNALHRQELLTLLYTARAARPTAGWENERVLAGQAPPAGACPDIAFALDVLTELEWIKRDGYMVRITGAGVLACEAALTA